MINGIISFTLNSCTSSLLTLTLSPSLALLLLVTHYCFAVVLPTSHKRKWRWVCDVKEENALSDWMSARDEDAQNILCWYWWWCLLSAKNQRYREVMIWRSCPPLFVENTLGEPWGQLGKKYGEWPPTLHLNRPNIAPYLRQKYGKMLRHMWALYIMPIIVCERVLICLCLKALSLLWAEVYFEGRLCVGNVPCITFC